jgi:NAD dependent epimerase/dehydratase family enzyme
MMRVLVTGGTGLVGSRLVSALLARGDVAVVLSRDPEKARAKLPEATQIVGGDPCLPGAWQEELLSCDGVIHLAGAGVFDRRWSASYKRQLIESRLLSTHHVVEALRRSPRRDDGSPRVLVSTSAVGYYGPHGDEILTEEHISTIPEEARLSYRQQYPMPILVGQDAASPAPASPREKAAAPVPLSTAEFMIQLCIDWESEAQQATQAGVRVAIVRVGIVLDKKGGALAQLLTPFRLGVGGPVGTGQQYMSWIHHDDLVRLYLWALDNPDVQGVLNGTAPNPVTNKSFGQTLGRVLGRPAWVWTPAFALFLLFGEAAAIVVEGQRVVPQRAQQLGFTFRYPELESALREILA